MVAVLVVLAGVGGVGVVVSLRVESAVLTNGDRIVVQQVRVEEGARCCCAAGGAAATGVKRLAVIEEDHTQVGAGGAGDVDGAVADVVGAAVARDVFDGVVDVAVVAGGQDVEVVLPLAVVDGVGDGDGAAPEHALDGGGGVGVAAAVGGDDDGVSLKVHVHCGASGCCVALGRAPGNVIGSHSVVAKVTAKGLKL